VCLACLVVNSGFNALIRRGLVVGQRPTRKSDFFTSEEIPKREYIGVVTKALKHASSVLKVLVVDDTQLVRERLVAMLREIKGVILAGEAEDAPGAMLAVTMLHPDVVILDIRMPSGSGIDVLREIKRQWAEIAVIMLTNYPYPQYRRRCMEFGASYFFDKSTEFGKIEKSLKELAIQKVGAHDRVVAAGILPPLERKARL
jgi:DNA-binding NarL/FixJ family response regulator